MNDKIETLSSSGSVSLFNTLKLAVVTESVITVSSAATGFELSAVTRPARTSKPIRPTAAKPVAWLLSRNAPLTPDPGISTNVPGTPVPLVKPTRADSPPRPKASPLSAVPASQSIRP